MTQNNKLPVIVFDFGGVLIDWNPYYLYRKVFKSDAEIKAFLEEIDFLNWNHQFDKGYPFEKGVEEKCAQFPHRAELIRRFNSHWMDAKGEILADTCEVVHKLKSNGYTLYGLSNWSVTKFELVKEGFYFLNWLDGYMLSGQVQHAKPEAAFFDAFLEKFSLSAGDCLFVDDVEKNIRAAENIGFQTIQFQSAEQLTRELICKGIKV
jgi:2-haloacid dehalogenase